MNPATETRALVALRLAAVTAVAGGLWLLVWYWPGGLPYDATSGVWTALADDFARGDLYRPVHGELGYGGTRYLPLFFVLHGTLIRAGLAAGTAGMLLTFASIGLLGAAAYRLMRILGAGPALAWPCVLLLPASIAFQLLGVAVKGDLLAAACSAGGLAAAVAWNERGWRPGFAFACGGFAAAILTKFTAVFALVALGLWLVRSGRRARAGALAAGVLAVVGAGLAAVQGLSVGRLLESFAACVTGGLGTDYAWKFPGWFALVVAQDPFFLALFLAAAAAAIRRFRRTGLDLPLTYFIVTALGTMLLFVSPGIDSNHLMDLLVAAVVLLAVELTQGGAGRGVAVGAGVFAAAVAATWLPGVPSVRHFFAERGRPTLEAVQEIDRRLPATGPRRLLAENPLVPVVLGQRPEVLDCFSLRLIAARSPAVRAEFMENLAARRYTAVVLVDWSGAPVDELPAALARHSSPGVAQFYGEVHFPAGFLDALWRNYRLSFVVRPFVVLEPRATPP
jgi:hypothetical protein